MKKRLYVTRRRETFFIGDHLFNEAYAVRSESGEVVGAIEHRLDLVANGLRWLSWSTVRKNKGREVFGCWGNSSFANARQRIEETGE